MKYIVVDDEQYRQDRADQIANEVTIVAVILALIASVISLIFAGHTLKMVFTLMFQLMEKYPLLGIINVLSFIGVVAEVCMQRYAFAGEIFLIWIIANVLLSYILL